MVDQNERAIPEQVVRKSIIAGSIGVFVHWFDWGVYAYLATTLGHVFFTEQDDTAALLSVFVVFAVSFAIRPLGSVILGPLGDKIGRQRTLSIVILMMAGGTLLVGLLPSYESIGLWAPALLVVARVVQGLAAGGEFGSAAAFLAEYSPRKRRGLGTSWLEVGSLLGFLVASLTVAGLNEILSQEAVLSWGWRIPFLLAAPLAIIGFYIRLKIEDTPEYQVLEQADEVPKTPIRELFSRNKRELGKMGGIEIMQHVTFYIVTVYLVTYQAEYLSVSPTHAALATGITSTVAFVFVPIFGGLSDRIGRKPVLQGAAAGLIILSYPMFWLMHRSDLSSIFISQSLLGILLAAILGTHAVAMAEMFPTSTRQGGLSIGYNVTAAIFAGTVPYVLTWAITGTGNTYMPAFYLILVGAVGLFTATSLTETKGTVLRRSHDEPAKHVTINSTVD